MTPAPRYGLHSLRHAAASLFIEQGFSPKRVQALMGHSTIQMTFETCMAICGRRPTTTRSPWLNCRPAWSADHMGKIIIAANCRLELDQAVDVLIEHQAAFVDWWNKSVSVRHGAGRGGIKKHVGPLGAGRGLLLAATEPRRSRL
jgi:hypothetical protein